MTLGLGSMANYVLFDFIQSDKLKILALRNLCNKVVNSTLYLNKFERSEVAICIVQCALLRQRCVGGILSYQILYFLQHCPYKLLFVERLSDL